MNFLIRGRYVCWYLNCGEPLRVLFSEHTQLIFSTFLFIDVNNDGFLDEQELEALFTKEVKKKT